MNAGIDKRELDKMVAAAVMGYSRVGNGWWRTPGGDEYSAEYALMVIPHYTSDIAADYGVLHYVRENWNLEMQERFTIELNSIWHHRWSEAWFDGKRPGYPKPLNYEVGDYSRAALAAVGIKP
jgi:hypothetical protein